MTPKLFVALAAATVALLAAGAASAKTYFGIVGPRATITFQNAAGNKVSRIPAGTHTVRVSDKSSAHNFHLRGQGLNRRTRVRFVGQRTWTLTFPEGLYRYRCVPHAQAMKGSFRAAA